MQEMHRIFDRSTTGMDAGRELMRLQQRSSSVSDYAIEFQTLVTDSSWEGRAVIDTFLHGLTEPIKDELLTRDLPEELDRIITLVIRIDTRLEDRRRLVKPRSPPRFYRRRPRVFPPPQDTMTIPTPATSSGGEPEVMIVDRSRITKVERDRWVRTRSCLYCGGAGHFASNCPVKGTCPLVERRALVGIFSFESSTRSRTCLPVTLDWLGGTQKTSALLDSGAKESFLDAETAVRWGIPLVEVSRPLEANSLNGQNIGHITWATIPLRLCISGNHQEEITPHHRHSSFASHPGPSMDGQTQS